MEFNEFVLEKLDSILQKHGIYIFEQHKNYLKLKSNSVTMVLSHDDRECASSFYIGLEDGTLYLIDDEIIKNVFSSDTWVEDVTLKIFVNNLSLFFEGKGRLLLEGDVGTFKALEKWTTKRNDDYNVEIADRQNLEAANIAWQNGNYQDFINFLNKINPDKLQPSYTLKYKIARQRLKN
jgi:hypothetical protein